MIDEHEAGAMWSAWPNMPDGRTSSAWRHQASVPAVIERRRVTLVEAGLPTLPYHHDSIGMREDEANALTARVRRSIAACTSRALHGIVTGLAPGYAVVALAIREPPFPELPGTIVADLAIVSAAVRDGRNVV
jgi:hypothetical protein